MALPPMSSIVKLERQLGTGTCGVVYEGYDEESGSFVAIKEISFNGDEEAAARIMEELRILAAARHPRLIRYLGARRGPHGVQLLMERASAGSLEELLQLCPGQRLRERVARRYTRHILEGLRYLHDEMKVCHRDIKPGNVLLTTDGECKLADFSAAKVFGTGRAAFMQTMVGTPWYIAPEVLAGGAFDDDESPLDIRPLGHPLGEEEEEEDGGYTTSADIWSLGVTVYEMVSGARPYGGDLRNPTAVLFNLTKAARHPPPPLPPEVRASPELEAFIALCLVYDHTLRPSAAELLGHRWFTQSAGSSRTTLSPPLGPKTAPSTRAGVGVGVGGGVGAGAGGGPTPRGASPTSGRSARAGSAVKFGGVPLLDALDVMTSATVGPTSVLSPTSCTANVTTSPGKRAGNVARPARLPQLPQDLSAAGGPARPAQPTSGRERRRGSRSGTGSAAPRPTGAGAGGIWSSDGHFVDIP